jgi:hypothetical protein
MTRRTVRLPTDENPFLTIVSRGRDGPHPSGGFSQAQIDQIARTVRRTPEVMVKSPAAERRSVQFKRTLTTSAAKESSRSRPITESVSTRTSRKRFWRIGIWNCRPVNTAALPKASTPRAR